MIRAMRRSTRALLGLALVALVAGLLAALLAALPATSSATSAAATRAAELQVDLQSPAGVKTGVWTTIPVKVYNWGPSSSRPVTVRVASIRGVKFKDRSLKTGWIRASETAVVRFTVLASESAAVGNRFSVTASASGSVTGRESDRLIVIKRGKAPRSGKWKLTFAGSSSASLRFSVSTNRRRVSGLSGVMNLYCYSSQPPSPTVRPVKIYVPALTADRYGRVNQKVVKTYVVNGVKHEHEFRVGARFLLDRTTVGFIDVWAGSCYGSRQFRAARR